MRDRGRTLGYVVTDEAAGRSSSERHEPRLLEYYENKEIRRQ
jgi:hypothetical protein